MPTDSSGAAVSCTGYGSEISLRSTRLVEDSGPYSCRDANYSNPLLENSRDLCVRYSSVSKPSMLLDN